MNLVTAKKIYHSFGDRPLLDHVDFSIESGERICIVGRNGTGKSTLLKIVAGHIRADDGDLTYAGSLKIADLNQEVPENISGTVYDCVATGIGKLAETITGWHHLALQAASDSSVLTRLQQLQDEIEANHAWNLEHRISATITKLGLPADAPFDSLSGGMKRRALLGQALVAEPDLLLLDEPTNHLDIESILWLQDFLIGFPGSLLFITHDRAFLQAVATRILDLDRGRLTSWPGSYQKYCEAKQAWLNNEVTQNALFDKKLAQEEAWIREGIKARRTRNEGRVRALKKLRQQRAERRDVIGKVRIEAQKSEQSGKIVIEADNIGFAWPDKAVIKNFSVRILRGDKIGLIGPNGCGKSTLIQLLLKQLSPQQGSVSNGTRLEVAYFDQHRETLDMNKSVRDNLSSNSDEVTINGRSKHVISYLKDFLFNDKQIHMPVRALSGGERNRLLLARLFTRSFNLLVMDEPTNDLDIETLELLEELLIDYDGSLILVSHDREFIDNTVTSTLVFDAPCVVNAYVGGYSDWLRQRPQSVENPGSTAQEKIKADTATKSTQTAKPSRELKSLPSKIEKLESEIENIHLQFAEPGFFQQEADTIKKAQQQLATCEKQLEQLYQRWEELESGA